MLRPKEEQKKWIVIIDKAMEEWTVDIYIKENLEREDKSDRPHLYENKAKEKIKIRMPFLRD